MEDNKALFETMPVPRALAKLAIPTIISQLITMIYNLADTFFIGQSGDPNKVAAASLAYVLFFMMNALANLFGVGGGSLISRLLGKNEPGEAKNVFAFSIYGSAAAALIYSAACFIFMEPLLKLLGASDNTIGYAGSYLLWVVVIGGLPSTLSISMSHLLRCEGCSSEASFGLSMGGVLNILLDPLFMFVLLPDGNEVTGAAAATLVSNIASLVYFVVVFRRLRGRMQISASPRDALSGARHAWEVLYVGFPSAVGTLLVCVAIIVENNLASTYGDVPVAAMGIVKKIDTLPMNVGMGLCQGMIPLVAYNFASGDYRRMRSAANCARACGVGFSVLCLICFELFAGGVIRLFIGDADTVELGAVLLRIAAVATPLKICNFQMSYTFQAMGKGGRSLLLSSCRQGLFSIPLLFLMNHIFGLYGVPAAQAVADGITLIISFVLYRGMMKKLEA